jgi:hypothetical protein
VTDGFDLWFKQTAHQIESLLAATNLAQNALIGGTAAIRSSAEAIRSTAIDGQQWLLAHPCPDGQLDDRFGVLLQRYEDVGIRFEEYIPALTRQVGTLAGDLADFIADIQHRLED